MLHCREHQVFRSWNPRKWMAVPDDDDVRSAVSIFLLLRRRLHTGRKRGAQMLEGLQFYVGYPDARVQQNYQ